MAETLGTEELSRPFFPTSLILSKAFLPSNFSGHCLNTSNDGKLTTSQARCSIFRQLNALLDFPEEELEFSPCGFPHWSWLPSQVAQILV